MSIAQQRYAREQAQLEKGRADLLFAQRMVECDKYIRFESVWEKCFLAAVKDEDYRP